MSHFLGHLLFSFLYYWFINVIRLHILHSAHEQAESIRFVVIFEGFNVAAQVKNILLHILTRDVLAAV